MGPLILSRACDQSVDTPSSVLQEKDITPDPQLLDKFNDCTSQMDFMRFHNQPVTQLPSDLADITDFFIALTICNTVVVSSPNQPRQKVQLTVTLRGSPRDAKQMVARIKTQEPLEALTGGPSTMLRVCLFSSHEQS